MDYGDASSDSDTNDLTSVVQDTPNPGEKSTVEKNESESIFLPPPPLELLDSIVSTACASNFLYYASDYGLIVPNGSYAQAAGHCVQCSCALGSHKLYCEPASLVVSCSSMQCRNSNLILGNITVEQSSTGCNVTTCDYNGFSNGTILTMLSRSLQPRYPIQ